MAWSRVNNRAGLDETIHAPPPLPAACRLTRAVATTLPSPVRIMHSSLISITVSPSLEGGAAGAEDGSQRVQTPPDSPRPTRIVCAGEGLPDRLRPTVSDFRNLHGMQKVSRLESSASRRTSRAGPLGW